jgi:hypothetical protein
VKGVVLDVAPAIERKREASRKAGRWRYPLTKWVTNGLLNASKMRRTFLWPRPGQTLSSSTLAVATRAREPKEEASVAVSVLLTDRTVPTALAKRAF